MKSLFIMLSQLIIVVVIFAEQPEYRYPPPPQELLLRIKKDDGEIINVNLLRVKSVLANINLPIIVTAKVLSAEYGQLPRSIMDGIGEFAIYHDYCTKSALIYFRKEGILNGVVDVSYSVIDLPIAKSNSLLKLNAKYLKLFPAKQYLKKSRKLRSNGNNSTGFRSQRDILGRKPVYPELLVAISYDMHQALGNNYAKTISHVLTVYNAADMLFRFVKSVSIKLNIAAIVIETIKNRWNFIPKMTSSEGIEFINADTINWDISKHFRFRENYFARDSYDFVAYNTRMPLMSVSLENRNEHGVSLSAFRDFMFPPGDPQYDRCNIAVRDYNLYESYSTIAHELAHVFTAKHDRVGSQFFGTLSCARDSIMTELGCTKSCLQWSRKTEREFTEFFRSPAYCSLNNRPHSLHPQKPREVFSGEQQCRCYGAEEFVKPDMISRGWCGSPLQCKDKTGEIQPYPSPMDGTPCAPGKVCWHYFCVLLETNV